MPTRPAKEKEALGIPTPRGKARCANATKDQAVWATTGLGFSLSDAMTTAKRTVRKPARKEGQVLEPHHNQMTNSKLVVRYVHPRPGAPPIGGRVACIGRHLQHSGERKQVDPQRPYTAIRPSEGTRCTTMSL